MCGRKRSPQLTSSLHNPVTSISENAPNLPGNPVAYFALTSPSSLQQPSTPPPPSRLTGSRSPLHGSSGHNTKEGKEGERRAERAFRAEGKEGRGKRGGKGFQNKKSVAENGTTAEETFSLNYYQIRFHLSFQCI